RSLCAPPLGVVNQVPVFSSIESPLPRSSQFALTALSTYATNWRPRHICEPHDGDIVVDGASNFLHLARWSTYESRDIWRASGTCLHLVPGRSVEFASLCSIRNSSD